MRKILVTGGAGFIGSNFVEYWFNRYPDDQLTILDALTYAGNPQNFPQPIKESPRFLFWYGSILNDELVNDLVSKADIVVHFAAESHVARSIFDNKTFYLTDVIGTQVVANAVLKNYRTVERFVHISTSEVYGTAQTKPMTEEHPLNPLTPYASAKAGADRLVYSYWATYDIPVVIIRPFNNYGPQQHLEKVIPRFITAALKDEPLNIHGGGSASRDWLHVHDTCARLDLVINAPLEKVKGEVFNIGSGFEMDILAIAQKILKITGRSDNLITFMKDRLGQVQNHLSSTQKATEILGTQTGIPFDEGLEKTVTWYDQHREWWKPLEWMMEVPVLTKEGKVVHY